MCVGMVAGLTLSSCHKEEEHGHEGGEEQSQLLVTRPIRRDTDIKHEFVCQIRSCRNIEIRAMERGYLEKIFVNEGQLVKEGDPMFKILALAYQAELKSAEADAKVAQVEYENTKRLTETQVVSDKELAMAKAKWDDKIAAVNLKQAHFGFTNIKAPFSGLMDRLRLRNGSLVNEGDLLTTLSDNSEMWVYFNVPESEYLEYASHEQSEESKQVRLIMANGKLFDQKGRINVIEGEFDNRTGTIQFRADFPNPDRLLRHGETGSILMTKALKNALLIPQKSTFENEGDHFVFILDKDDILREKKIKIVEELEDLFVISDGVTEFDRIIFEGMRQARDGEKAHEFEFVETEEAYKHLKLKAE
jgi:membrane fusion protein (multidrug efflux system)